MRAFAAVHDLICRRLPGQRRAPSKLPVTIEVGGGIRPTGRLIAHRIPGPGSPHQGMQSWSITDTKGVSVTSNMERDGAIRFSLRGKSPQGEATSLEVCSTHVNRLNLDG